MADRRTVRVVAGLGALVLVGGAGIGVARAVTLPKDTIGSYRTALVSTGTITQTLALSGSVQRVNQVKAAFPGSGTVTAVDVKTGDHVDAGQVIATIDGVPLQAALLDAQAQLAQTQAQLDADSDPSTTGKAASGAGASGSAAADTTQGSASGAKGSGSRSTGSGSAASPQRSGTAPSDQQTTTQQAAPQPPEAQPSSSQQSGRQHAGGAPAPIVAPAPLTDVTKAMDAVHQALAAQQAACKPLVTAKASSGQTTSGKAGAATGATTTGAAYIVPATSVATPTPTPTHSASSQQSGSSQPLGTPSSAATPSATSTPSTSSAASGGSTAAPATPATPTGPDPAQVQACSGSLQDLTTAENAALTVLNDVAAQLSQSAQSLQAAEKQQATQQSQPRTLSGQQPGHQSGAPDQGGQSTQKQSGTTSDSAGQGSSTGSAGAAGSAGSSSAGGARGSGASGSGSGKGGSTASGAQGAGGSSGQVDGTVNTAKVTSDNANVLAAQQNLSKTQQNLDAATLKAPIAGVVGQVGLTVGQTAGTTSAVTIVGDGAAEVTVSVPLANRPEVAVGQKAQVSPAGSTESDAGSVTDISLLPDSSNTSATPTYGVTILVPQPGAGLQTGARADTAIVLDQVDNVLTVPASAATKVAQNQASVRVLDGTTVSTKTVTTGVVGNGLVQIASGLTAGQTLVVADASQALPSNMSGTRGMGGAPDGQGPQAAGAPGGSSGSRTRQGG